MGQVFHIGDLHFYHKRITDFGKATGTQYRTGDDYMENMHHLILNWNRVVNKRDLVFVHGDVCFTRNKQERDVLHELNGNKKLIIGNHDSEYWKAADWLEYFDDLAGILKYKGFWLTHAPIHPDELRGKKNIHGHVHANSIRNGYTGEYDERYINVSCEAIWETPIPHEMIRNGDYYNYRRC